MVSLHKQVNIWGGGHGFGTRGPGFKHCFTSSGWTALGKWALSLGLPFLILCIVLITTSTSEWVVSTKWGNLEECAAIITYSLLSLRMAVTTFFKVPPYNCSYPSLFSLGDMIWTSFPDLSRGKQEKAELHLLWWPPRSFGCAVVSREGVTAAGRWHLAQGDSGPNNTARATLTCACYTVRAGLCKQHRQAQTCDGAWCE